MFWKKKKKVEPVENTTLAVWHKFPILCHDPELYKELTKFLDKKEPFVVFWHKVKSSRFYKEIKKFFCSHSWYDFRNFENFNKEGHEIHNFHICRKCNKTKLLNIERVTYGSEQEGE